MVRILEPKDAALLMSSVGVFDRAVRADLAAQFLGDPRHHIAAAIADDRIVGFVSAVHYLHPDKDPELWINEVGVHEDPTARSSCSNGRCSGRSPRGRARLRPRDWHPRAVTRTLRSDQIPTPRTERCMMRRVSTLSLLIPALLMSSGCVGWSRVDVDPETLITRDAPERIRVTRDDGEQLTLESPQVRAGALVATAAPGAVLLEDVEAVEVEGVSFWRTLGVALGSALIVVGVAISISGL